MGHFLGQMLSFLPGIIAGMFVLLFAVFISESLVRFVRFFGHKMLKPQGVHVDVYAYRALTGSSAAVVRYVIWSYGLMTALPIFGIGVPLQYFIQKLWSSIPIVLLSLAAVFLIHLCLPKLFPNLVIKTRTQYKRQQVHMLTRNMPENQLDAALDTLQDVRHTQK